MIKNIHADDININSDIIIDIRRESEFMQTGIIENSHTLTFFKDDGTYDLLSWLREFKKIVQNLDDKFILVCAHAHRTQSLGDYLIKELEYSNAYHLEGGIAQWINLNKECIKY
ncbi:MAG: rhodanese-like domain-containing protein [Campylobacteraceae bacterium]|nr:rhodanese-like domain-containing protein [Campylobacteraceae bacterium]